MNPAARIAYLSRWLKPGSVGAEIGVWKGDFSEVILREVTPSRLFLVDPWEFRPEVPRAWYGGGRASDQAAMEAIHLEVMTRFACEIETQQVVILRSKSNQVTVPVELDWVYIDADHTRDAVRADIDHWRTQVKPGGLVILDDYGIRGWWDDGVRRAADEARTDGVVELLEIGGSQAVLQVVP